MMFGQYSQYEFGRSAPGNYELKPSVQNIIRLSFANAKKITTLIEFYYEHTKNPVQMLSRINGTMIIDQPENLKQRKSFGAVFSLTCPVVPFYSFTLNTDARINQHRFHENIFVLHPQSWSASASLVNRFTLNKKINIAVNASIHNWRTTVYRTMEKIVVIGMQGSYKINQKTNLSFSFNDMFNNMRFAYSGNLAQGFYERSFGKDRMRNLSISLRYQLINSQLDKKTSTLKSFMSE
jgi:hypothetical protein